MPIRRKVGNRWRLFELRRCPDCGVEHEVRTDSPSFVCGKCNAKRAQPIGKAAQNVDMILRECPICGGAFKRYPSYFWKRSNTKTKGAGTFCSRACYAVYQKGRTK